MLTASSACCGSPSVVNVMDALQLTPLQRSGWRTQVTNRASASCQQSLPSNYMPSAALCQEWLEWGRMIVLRRTVHVAEHLLPGISTLHHARQLYTSLSAAQRGDLRSALQQLPLRAVLPASLLSLLRETLQAHLPEWLQQAPDHEHVVLLVAALALWGPSSSRAMQRRTPSLAVRGLRAVRSVLEAVHGMRNVLSMPEARSEPLAWLALPRNNTAVALVPDQMTALAPSLPTPWAARASARSLDVLDDPWPFPGASARPKGKPRPKPAAQPPPKPAVSTNAKGPRAQGRGLQRQGAVRRTGLGGNAQPEQPPVLVRGNPASRNPAAMTGYADVAQDPLQSPLKHPNNGFADEGGNVQRVDPAPLPGASSTAGPPPTARAGRAGPTADRATGTPPRDAGTPEEVPACIVVDDAIVARLLVRRERYRPELVRFCVQSEETPWFKSLFRVPADSARGMGRWMASEIISEQLPRALQTVSVRRFDGELDVDDAPAGTAVEPVGDKRAFALLTLSLLDAPLRREAGGWNLTFMQRNTFRLLRYAGAGDVEGLYLAYFMHQESDSCSGVKGGFLEVEVDADGQLSVADVAHGTRIAAPSQGALIASIEKLTGLRCANAGGADFAAIADPATNLFVDEAQTRSLQSDDQHLRFNAGLDPFAPVWVAVEGHTAPFTLYRSSFMQMGDQIVHADDRGRTGTLSFGRHVLSAGRRQLLCRTDHERTFAARTGLDCGVFHDPETVMEKLEQHGLVWMPGQPSPWGSLTPTGHASCETAITASAVDVPAGELDLLPMDFSFQSGDLRYIDEHGHRGVLAFKPVAVARASAAPRYQLVDHPHTRDFAARHELDSASTYSEADIVWQLRRAGFDRVEQ